MTGYGRSRIEALGVGWLLVLQLLRPAMGAGLVDTGYREPPPAARALLESPRLPLVSVDPSGRYALLVEREEMPPISVLARPELELEGRRFVPSTSIRYAEPRYEGLVLKDLRSLEETRVELPSEGAIGLPQWSTDGRRFAFASRRAEGVELWAGDAEHAAVRKVLGPVLSAVGGRPCGWMPGDRRLVCRLVPEGRGPAALRRGTPRPRTMETDASAGGGAARARGHASLFDCDAASQLAFVDVDSGTVSPIGEPAFIERVLPSPDGNYLLIWRLASADQSRIEFFPRGASVEVWDRDGQVRRVVVHREGRGPGPMRALDSRPRGVSWEESAPATLTWFQAEGGEEQRPTRRDRVMRLPAPFSAPPGEVFASSHRVAGIQWMASGSGALVKEYDRRTQSRWTWLVAGSGVSAGLLWSSQRASGGPAPPQRLLTAQNDAGREVIAVHDGFVYLTGRELSGDGSLQFLDRFNLATQLRERLWQSPQSEHEVVLELIARDASRLLVRHESRSEPPSYVIVDLATGERRSLTEPVKAAQALNGIRRERLRYRRADGVELSATLYLPPGGREKIRLPLVMWAYPAHYVDSGAMPYTLRSPDRFPSLHGLSPLVFATQGYAVMMDVAMPVVGPADTANDTFVDQIIANAAAAIDAAVDTGLVDRDRVGIMGHSYGAFMVVNLLAHSDLFKAGIAASGAYNRTLTPFGFQTERRSLWEARGAYLAMSPFLYADQIKEPLLLVHGELDDNAATAPEQSERLYWAIRENGGTARLVMLPFEGHVYRARESVLHVAAEMLEWFDRHLHGPVSRGLEAFTAKAEDRPPG